MMEQKDFAVFFRFFKPQPDVQYVVTLANWHRTDKSFAGKLRPQLAFDVIDIDGQPTPEKEWSTSSISFIEKIMPIINDAQSRGSEKIRVALERTSDNRYNVTSMSIVERALPPGYRVYPREQRP